MTIDLHGPWSLYAGWLPQGSTALGTITRDAGDTGALVQLPNGYYAQANAGVLRTLDQRVVRRALEESRPCP